MAGSHTMMPGILFSGNTVLNVTNTTSGIANNQQSITLPFNHSLNGGVGINGHSNNVITTTSILRPANKIIVQGPSNNLTLVNSQNSQFFNTINHVIQTSNNGIIEKDTGHNFFNIIKTLPDGNKKLEVINSTVPLMHTLNTSGIHTFNSSGIHTINSSGIHTINSSGIHTINSTGIHSGIYNANSNMLHSNGPSVVQSINSSAMNTLHSSSFQTGNSSVAQTGNPYFIKKEVDNDLSIVKQEVVDIVKKEIDSDIEEIQPQDEPVAEEEEEPVIDIMINNVVCSFSVGCHLDLRNIALNARNVEFRKENGMVTLKLRRPLTTASIWSSGKITCTGSTSEDQARIAARRVARALQKLGYNTKFRNYRIVNVLGTCTMPFAIRIANFSQMHRKNASYEPELHPGVTYRIESPKATLKIFSTGSITVTAPCVSNVQSAIEIIYPLVKDFSKQRSPEELSEIRRLQKRKALKEEEEEEEISDEDI